MVDAEYTTPAHGMAADIGIRNRSGTMKNFFNQQLNQGYNSPRPVSRVGNNSDASQNLENARGTMGKYLDLNNNRGYTSPRPEARAPSPEAKDNMAKSRGVMGGILNVENNLNYSSPRPEPRVKADAQEYASKNRGNLGNTIGGGYPTPVYSHVPTAPRVVKPEAKDNEVKNRGTLTHLQRNYGNESLSPRLAPRVKPEAESIARASMGSVQHLFKKYGNLPLSARQVPRVKPEASKIATLSQGTIGGLLGQGNSRSLRASTSW